MGYVTVTESEYVGEVTKTTSITFECFEDFLAYDKKTREDTKLDEGQPITDDELPTKEGPLTELEVGKEYRVIGNSNGHEFEIGEVVRITGRSDDEGEYTAEYLNGRDYWYVVAKDLEEI